MKIVKLGFPVAIQAVYFLYRDDSWKNYRLGPAAMVQKGRFPD